MGHYPAKPAALLREREARYRLEINETENSPMRLSLVFWVSLAATLVLYLVLVLWSLPRISAEAGGAVPFDLRPMGYSFDEAQAFLAALSAEGRAHYLGTQHQLDWIYPALLGTTFITGFSLLFRRAVLWVLVPLALSVTALDWLENMAVAELLRADLGSLQPSAVTEASRWSMLKSLATTLAWLLLLGGGTAKAIGFFRRRRQE
jgi:hypothetical protein